MKNIKRIAYIVVIVILLILSLTIYTNASKNDESDQKNKTFSQIKYMEGKIANLLNTMNNIEARNYSVVTSEMSKATTQKSNSENSSSSGSSQGGQGGGKSSSGSSSQGSGSEEPGGSNDSSEGTGEGEDKKEKKFELEASGVLTNTQDINWDIIKSEVENLYTSLPAITMDLYQFNINQEDILGFNSQYDKLTSVVKEEKKQEALNEMVKVYEYFPKFLRGSGQDTFYTTLVETKVNVFKGYSKLDTGNWQEISNDIKNAIDTYSKLLTNTEIEARKQYNVSKTYIMLNELQNASNLKDIAVFLIKYKNLLEEMNNI